MKHKILTLVCVLSLLFPMSVQSTSSATAPTSKLAHFKQSMKEKARVTKEFMKERKGELVIATIAILYFAFWVKNMDQKVKAKASGRAKQLRQEYDEQNRIREEENALELAHADVQLNTLREINQRYENVRDRLVDHLKRRNALIKKLGGEPVE